MRICFQTASSHIHVPNVVLAFVNVDGERLEHVRERWCNNGQVLLMCVKQLGRALRFARRMFMLNQQWNKIERR